MIAIQTITDVNYESRNPANIGKIRIEVKSVVRDPSSRNYYLHIVDSVIYKYNVTVPVYEEQEIQIPVLDEEGNETEEFTTEIQIVQTGTTLEERDGIRVYKENKRYPVSYEKALMLEQAVLAMFPPDESIQGADLRDYITKYGLYILTTQLEEQPTYNVEAENWVLL
jgi:hypothetical protein